MRPRNPCLCGHDEDIHCISMTVEKDRTITNEHRSNCEHEGCECKRFSPAPVPVSDTPEPTTVEPVQAVRPDYTIYREHPGDAYSPSIHVTWNGGIGINVGGFVFVRTIQEWHSAEARAAKAEGEAERQKQNALTGLAMIDSEPSSQPAYTLAVLALGYKGQMEKAETERDEAQAVLHDISLADGQGHDLRKLAKKCLRGKTPRIIAVLNHCQAELDALRLQAARDVERMRERCAKAVREQADAILKPTTRTDLNDDMMKVLRRTQEITVEMLLGLADEIQGLPLSPEAAGEGEAK